MVMDFTGVCSNKSAAYKLGNTSDGSPAGSVVKKTPANAGDTEYRGSVLG